MACYDVTHSVNIKTAYQKFKKLSCTQKYIALVLASLTGILHASQPFLGLLHLVKIRQPLAILGAQTVAATVKCITGSINAMQYAGMWATRICIRRSGKTGTQLLFYEYLNSQTRDYDSHRE